MAVAAIYADVQLAGGGTWSAAPTETQLGLQAEPVESYERLSFFGVVGWPYWTRVAKRRDPECIICGERSPVRAAGDSQTLFAREAAAAD